MERTVEPNPKLTYDKNQEPIILSKAVLDIILSSDYPADVLALYTFYYYTAKWQRVWRVKATTGYVAAGLKWGEGKVRKYKSHLIDLGLIENSVQRDSQGNITGHYVQIKFIWSQADGFAPPANEGDKCLNTIKNKKTSKKDLITKNIPVLWLVDKRLQTAIKDYVQMRTRTHPISALGAERIGRKCSKLTKQHAILCLEQSTEKEWRDIYPNAIDLKASDKDAADILDDFIKEHGSFFEDIFIHFAAAAEMLKVNSSANKSMLAITMTTLYNIILEKQTKKACDNKDLPSPYSFIREYIEWLDNQKWIKDIQPGVFTQGNKLLEQFMREISEEFDAHIFTGEAYNGEEIW